MGSLVERFQDYSSWRAGVTLRVRAFRRWLEDNELLDGQTEARLTHLLERLGDDKLTIAFVAEFSRGKSELINAIFFADYGRRLLPSSTGRTTMCPTELAWDPQFPPCIQLLPIETRAAHVTIAELKRFPEEWSAVSLDVNDPQGLVDAFHQVRVTKRVPIEEAKHYGFFATEAAARAAGLPADGMVEIPCWRHAIINFPHPLLEQGLVILDTPGLNAIGSEPELTLNLLPNAHALLFVLSVDTGVSKSDVDVWRDHLAGTPGQEKARFVVLNKIDSLWDGLRTDEDIDGEVGGQVESVAAILGVAPDHVVAVSAQKGLVAKITDDDQLLARSRLPDLEHALSAQLIPSKHELVRDATRVEVMDLVGNTRAILEARLAGVLEQLSELRALRGKNLGVVENMMSRVRREKEDFERGLARFQALRGVFAQRTNELFTHLGMDALKDESKRALREMSRSKLTPSLRSAMVGYFDGVRARLASAGEVIAEIHQMMEAMYRKFSEEHGLRLGSPPQFSLYRYVKEFERLERNFRTHFDTFYTMVTHEKLVLIEKFFETLASQVRRVYTYANRETEHWLRAVMSPMEAQVREHQIQLRRRLESIKRIHQATDALEDRIGELEDVERDLVRQLEGVHRIAFEIEHALELEPTPLAAAA
ncbi:MAG: dynamin family protein [Burkholderiales bacterium]|nr:dynamin family protein [Burkholderiales bacterium]